MVKVGAQCLLKEGMSSLTPEQYGLVGGVIAVAVLIHSYYDTQRKVTVTIWVDNQESLDRAQASFSQKIRLREFQVSDYGVMTVMQQLIRELRQYVDFRFQKVKSHQNGEEQDLPFEAILNNKADEYTGYINSIQGPRQVAPVYPSEGLMIRNNEGIKIKDVAAYVKLKIHGEDTKSYLQKKNGWSETTLHLIEWDGLKRYLLKIPLHKRLNMLQLIHNWQHVGKQKLQFEDSKKVTIETQHPIVEKIRETQRHDLAQCPFKCGKMENSLALSGM